jgi:hypothetical protein
MDDCDVFVYQPLSRFPGYNTGEILTQLPPHTTLISFPYIYFNSYFPDTCDNSAFNNRTITSARPFGLFPYGHSQLNTFILSHLEDLVLADLLAFIRSPFLSKDFIRAKHEECLTRLREKESSCTIKVVDFIECNFRLVRLFSTNNHPTVPVYQHVLDQISSILGFRRTDYGTPNERTNYWDIIFNCVSDFWELQFQTPCWLSGKQVTDEEYLEAYAHALFPEQTATFRKERHPCRAVLSREETFTAPEKQHAKARM